MEYKSDDSVVVETVSETSHLCWNNETIRFKSSLTSIIIESTYLTLNLTLNMNKIWGRFKVQVGWKNAFYGETGSRKGLEKVSPKPWPLKKSVNKIKIYQFSMFKSLDSIASVVWIFMYLTISKFKQVLRSRKGLRKVSTTQCLMIVSIFHGNIGVWRGYSFTNSTSEWTQTHTRFSTIAKWRFGSGRTMVTSRVFSTFRLVCSHRRVCAITSYHEIWRFDNTRSCKCQNVSSSYIPGCTHKTNGARYKRFCTEPFTRM